MDWTLVFSPSGATIVICGTLLLLVVLFLLFPDRFKGAVFGYKDIRIEIPQSTKSPEPKIEEIRKPAVEEFEPKKSDDEDPMIALYEAVEDQDRARIEKAYQELKRNPPPGFSQPELEAFKLFQTLNAGFPDALLELKAMESKFSNDSAPSRYLARYYLRIRAIPEAKAHAQAALKRASNDEDKRFALEVNSEIDEQESNKKEAARNLEQQIQLLSDPNEQSKLYVSVGRLYKESGNSILATLAYEKALNLNQEDSDARFALALIYADLRGLKHLALRHYQIILRQNRKNNAALNNIGLLFGEFGNKIESVKIIQRAAFDGDGHAIGNLAATYLDAGFLGDAEKLLSNPPPSAQDSERIIAVRAQIQNRSRQSEESAEKLRAEADKLWSLIHDFKLVTDPVANTYHGKWEATDDYKTLEISNESSCKITFRYFSSTYYGVTFSLEPITRVSIGTEPIKTSQTTLLGMTMENRPNKLVLLLGDGSVRALFFEGETFTTFVDFRKKSQPQT